MYTSIYLDVETSGLYPNKHSILQIAALAIQNGQEVDCFTEVMKPCPGDEVDIEALKCNGITYEMMEAFPESKVVWYKFKTWLEHFANPFDKMDKLFFVGYNAKFDEDFVRSWFKKNGSNYYGSYFWVPSLDVMPICLLALMEKRQQLPDFKLGTVASALEIDFKKEDLHDAVVDIRLTRITLLKALGKLLDPSHELLKLL